MAQFETGHPQQLTRESRGRLGYRLGDQIEGRHVVTPPKKEPTLIRQKHPPVSVQDAKPDAPKKDRRTVRCRHILRAGQPKVVLLVEARPKFQSHALKCQDCKSRPLCAGD